MLGGYYCSLDIIKYWLKKLKRYFTLTKVDYLYRIISNGQLLVSRSKTATIADWPEPANINKSQ